MRIIPKAFWIPAILLIVAGAIFLHNRPAALTKAILMSTPLIFRDGLAKPYEALPEDVTPPTVRIFYATDRQPSDMNILHPTFYGNDRSMALTLGTAHVQFGDEKVPWSAAEKASMKKDRSFKVPLQVVRTSALHTLESIPRTPEAESSSVVNADRFAASIQRRLAQSDKREIYIFVPGFKVGFSYPVLVAAELWHYMGYRGAFIAYSWPSGQRLRNYLADLETTALTAQHFRMLLIYLAEHVDAERIHILSYSAGARIVSQALHELRLMAYGLPSQQSRGLKIGQVIFAAPDIDLMLFAARYRDGFEDMADTITIYTNANDTALNWALRFLGWPRLGAPGDLGLNPDELQPLRRFKDTVMIDVSAAENAAEGNGHGYFVKSPWVSTDLLLSLKYGDGPSQRGLSMKEDGTIWKFADDYPKRIKRIAEGKSSAMPSQ